MSDIPVVSPSTENKRPSVSSKCLLNIRSIVVQNVSLNSNKRHASLRSSAAPPPLPLMASKEAINHLKIEENNRQSLPNHKTIDEVVSKIVDKKLGITNGCNRSNLENGQSNHVEKSQNELQSIPSLSKLSIDEFSPSTAPISSNEPDSKPHPSQTLNKSEPLIVPPLPLSSSMYPFGLSSSSSPHKSRPNSFPVQSTNRINEEYIAQLCQIIASSSSDNRAETKPIELLIHRQQSIPIDQFDSVSPTVSTLDDDDDDASLNSPLISINRSLDLPMNSSHSPTVPTQTVPFKTHLNERSQKESHPHTPTNYTRLPHSLRNENLTFRHPSQLGSIPSPLISNVLPRRPVPQFQSVRTPVQKSPITKEDSPCAIPSEVFDCCQTATVPRSTQRRSHQRNSHRQSTPIEKNMNEPEALSHSSRNVELIRQIMLNVAKRLTQDVDSFTHLPIVDTHCHFDLIFDRLRIKHRNLTKYFLDYQEFYPPGLSFELAIQVFWRPKQLTKDNWLNWYSKYLDDARVYGSCGIHPHWSSAWTETSIEDIERCLEHPKVVALGEIGLDFGPKNACPMHEQYRAFEGQLKLAAKWSKPIVIHSRDAYEQTFQLMKQYLQANHKIHLHCFVGTIDDVRLFTSYFTEIKFGFTPVITRSNFLHTVIEQLELTQILSETDSPYFTCEELHAYSRCAHPGMVYSVVEMVAQLRQLPVFDVACQLRENARHIYGV